MSQSIPVPGAGRITLALLAVVPAAMAYPWGASVVASAISGTNLRRSGRCPAATPA